MADPLIDSSRHRARWQPLGQALLDFHRGATTARISIHTDLWHTEATPVEEFYRPDDHPLPNLELVALDLCRGRILDLGAGAGRHALELQRRGAEVVAVDVASEAIEIMRERGVSDPRCGGLESVAGERFDTILLLMHGIGLVGTLAGLVAFLDRSRQHLGANGQLVFDSADLGLVMPEQFEEGLDTWRAGGIYPGEVEYRLCYRGLEGEPYPWLFVDPITLAETTEAAGLRLEIVARGRRGAYLARISTP